jgi:hypothetical protein
VLKCYESRELNFTMIKPTQWIPSIHTRKLSGNNFSLEFLKLFGVEREENDSIRTRVN